MTYKGVLCEVSAPGADGTMCSGYRRGCIRYSGHAGLHWNRLVEWWPGQQDLATVRPEGLRSDREMLALMLEHELRVPVQADDLRPNLGVWSHATHDVCRWEATIENPGKPHMPFLLCSWERMGSLVRQGIVIEPEDLCHYIVSCKGIGNR